MDLQKLTKAVDGLNEKYLLVLEDLCNIESPTADKEGVDRAVKYLTDLALEKGWETEVRRVTGAGDPACITINAGSAERPVVFSGHLDTVHPKGLFGYPPVRRDETKMYGPGVVDCKGGVVCAFMAMDALRTVGFDRRPVRLILQTDEETSSVTSGKATLAFMAEKAKDSVLLVNNEGNTDYESCVLQRKGIMRFRFNVKGRAAHSSKCTEGVSAIAEAAHKILELEKFKDTDAITCNCGVIEGGTVANTVAQECSFVADFRYFTPEQRELILKEVERVRVTSWLEGSSCEVVPVSSRPGMPLEQRNLDALERVNAIFESHGLKPLRWKLSFGGSDAANMTEAGLTVIDNIGMVGDLCHSAREFGNLDSLRFAALRLALIAAEI